MPPQASAEKPPSKRFNLRRTLGYCAAASVIFLSGFGIGSGRIVLNREQLYRKSVQKNLPANLDYSSVEKVYDTLRRDFDGQLDVQKLLDGMKAGLAAASGDAYTEYLNKQAAAEFDDQLTGTFSGIGAELGKDEQGNVVVIAPIAGFPAEKAGLKSKDIIAEVDGETTAGMSISDAVSRIRGEKGTKVKLTVVRNKSQQLELEIVRDTITIPSVESKILDGNIGYLKISRYGDDTTGLAAKAASDFKQKNIRGVILDVRGNPGGLLDQAVKVSSLWLEPGKTVLQEKRNNLVIKTYKAEGNAPLKDVPTVVLIDEGSASASEITAGALRDNKAATLLGVKSFGKGSVQQLEELGDGSILKVTIARWFTPNGTNIHKEGIKPDTEIKLDEEKFKAGTDTQLDAALASLLD